MSRRSRILAWTGALLLTITAVGCGNSGDAEKAAAEKAWSGLQQQKQALDADRAKLDELQGQAAAAAAEPAAGETTEASAPAATDLQPQIDALQKQISDEEDSLQAGLVKFINDHAPLQDQEMSEQEKAALRMKSDEDMRLAAEYIEKGGDYRRAIEIYQAALAVDPDNEKLQQALADAKANRYMTEDRFAAAQKKMTREEIRRALGQANLYNIREYPEKNAIAWFYPKEGGGAAGVFFQKDPDGNYRVYRTDFDAVKGRGEQTTDPGSR